MIHDLWTMNLFLLGIQIIALIYNEYAAFSYDMEHILLWKWNQFRFPDSRSLKFIKMMQNMLCTIIVKQSAGKLSIDQNPSKVNHWITIQHPIIYMQHIICYKFRILRLRRSGAGSEIKNGLSSKENFTLQFFTDLKVTFILSLSRFKSWSPFWKFFG